MDAMVRDMLLTDWNNGADGDGENRNRTHEVEGEPNAKRRKLTVCSRSLRSGLSRMSDCSERLLCATFWILKLWTVNQKVKKWRRSRNVSGYSPYFGTWQC